MSEQNISEQPKKTKPNVDKNLEAIIDKLEALPEEQAVGFLTALPQVSSPSDAIQILDQVQPLKRASITKRILNVSPDQPQTLSSVLVVDDDKCTRHIVKKILLQNNYRVFEAEDGQQGLEQVTKLKPELVILDVSMPIMDGWKFLEHLSKMPEFMFMPVVFLTSSKSLNTRARAFRLGAYDFLEKPFHVEELLFRVNKAVWYRQRIESYVGTLLDTADLQGKLDNMSLTSILSFMKNEEKTGFLLVRRFKNAGQEEKVKIFLRTGDVVKATYEGRGSVPPNEDVVYYALSWKEGYFSFVNSDVAVNEEIHRSTIALLIEGCSLLDKKRAGIK